MRQVCAQDIAGAISGSKVLCKIAGASKPRGGQPPEEVDLWHISEVRDRRAKVRVSEKFGLNYGPAVIGDVGSEHSLSFTVIGDTVNTASRLQALTRSLGTPLVVGNPLVSAVKATPCGAAALIGQLRDRGEQLLRGRDSPIRVWSLDQ